MTYVIIFAIAALLSSVTFSCAVCAAEGEHKKAYVISMGLFLALAVFEAGMLLYLAIPNLQYVVK